jgi:undecaprenyl pyrophosphate synthase
VKYLTLWALSTENIIKRDADEIAGIIKLIGHVPKLVPEFVQK